MSTRFPYSPAKAPPVPAVILTLSSPDGSRTVSGVSAHLDTAADQTVVPLPILTQLGLQPFHFATAQGFGGTAYRLGLYQVGLDIPGVARLVLSVLGHSNEPFLLLGRDVLNLFRITFDGPNQSVEFH
jgi:hypothetical protein